MSNFYDIAYAAGLIVSSPVWLLKSQARSKVFRALAQRRKIHEARSGGGPLVMLHAVSLGEINAARGLADRLLAERGDVELLITSTTDTGFNRATELFGKNPRCFIERYPLDFSGAVASLLDSYRPKVVALMELEIWPNFMLQCEKRNIPVLVVNGRVTLPSFNKYRFASPVTKPMFRRLEEACVQEEIYRERFIRLGAAPEKVIVTGTMKFDTATLGSRVPGDDALCAELGIVPQAIFPDKKGSTRFWVCGSTGPGEEERILDLYKPLKEHVHDLRLAIIPRKPERFDEVAKLIVEKGFKLVRRSAKTPCEGDAVILGDTMGELRKFYAISDVVFVGRTLVDLGPRQHGSDMIEPSALGKPTIVGPYTGNFAEAMNSLKNAGAIREVSDNIGLKHRVEEFLSHPQSAREIGARAQETIKSLQGATERHLKAVLKYL
jgi:3-deoxy-D-manno-octulosonic-acid transferase